MSVRMRHTRATTGDRRSHHALKPASLGRCVQCGAAHVRHRACLICGTYRGRQAINVATKVAKREKKRSQKGKTN